MTAQQSRKALRRAERRRRLSRSLLLTAGAVIAATVIALGGVGGTYALWSKASPTMSTTTLTAGTASMSVSQPDAFSLLAPGRTVSRSFTITNTGDTDVQAQVSTAGFSGTLATVATVQITDSPTCGAGNVVWSRTPSTQSNDGTVIATVRKGQSKTLCMTIAIDSAAPASTEGTTMTTSLSIVGVQP